LARRIDREICKKPAQANAEIAATAAPQPEIKPIGESTRPALSSMVPRLKNTGEEQE
jgi:hypothetical protein